MLMEYVERLGDIEGDMGGPGISRNISWPFSMCISRFTHFWPRCEENCL